MYDESTRTWSEMGEERIQLAQTTEHRIHFLMLHMLNKLQDVAGKNILDLGCGEDSYTRALAPSCHRGLLPRFFASGVKER